MREALAHPFLDSVRRAEDMIVASRPLTSEFVADLEMADLQARIKEEVLFHHPELADSLSSSAGGAVAGAADNDSATAAGFSKA